MMNIRDTGLNDLIYLGDSVYAGRDSNGRVWLMTWNGYPDDPRNRICLEPEVLEAFQKWLNKE